MRFHEMTEEELEAMRQRRKEVGREEYGDAHLERDLCKDMSEEIADTINQLDLLIDKCQRQNLDIEKYYCVYAFRECVSDCFFWIQEIDLRLPEGLAEDKPDRVWFDE